MMSVNNATNLHIFEISRVFHRYILYPLLSLDRYRFCCLSPNYRFLHYGDASNESTPSIESLPSKSMIQLLLK